MGKKDHLQPCKDFQKDYNTKMCICDYVGKS